LNWSRARTILIVSFLALDLFLGYVAFGSQHESSQVTSTEVQRALDRVKALGITVTAQIPRRVMAAPFLVIRPRNQDIEAISGRLLGTDRPDAVQSSKELSVWAFQNSRVTVLSTGVVIFTTEAKTGSPGTEVDARSAQAMVLRFLSERGLLPQDARLDFVERTGQDSFTVQYYQEYEGTPLFGGYITATVAAWGVSRVRFLWFNPVGFGTGKRSVVPATDALVKAVPSIVGKVGAGARLEAMKFGYLSEGMDAREWDAIPVWRLSFSGGVSVYVNGYTGDVEKVD
jgi:hypothetical protein